MSYRGGNFVKGKFLVLLIVPLIAFALFQINNVNVFMTNETIEADQEEVFESDTLIPVLMYHHFVEDKEKTSYTTITSEAFEEQMNYLKTKGYNAVSDHDLIDFYYHGTELPENPIYITMDDGYLSNYEIAYPILKDNDMKATIFSIASRTDKEYSLPRFTWDQAREMSDSGVMSIQSHTYDLHHKEEVDATEVSAMIAYDTEEYYEKIVSDLTLSKHLIEHELSKEAIAFSYPYGHYDETTLSAVDEAGYKIAVTVEHGVNDINTNPLELRRINVSPSWTGETIEKEIEKQKELLISNSSAQNQSTEFD